MSLTLSVLLIGYGVIITFFVIFAAVNLYHVFKFGFVDLPTFWATFLFLAVTALNIFIVWIFIQQIDWNTSLFMLDLFRQDLPADILF